MPGRRTARKVGDVAVLDRRFGSDFFGQISGTGSQDNSKPGFFIPAMADVLGGVSNLGWKVWGPIHQNTADLER